MGTPEPDRRPSKVAAYYVGTALSTLVVLGLVTGFWKTDIAVPYYQGGDALYELTTAKTVVDHGWYLVNPDLGYPGRLEMADFPGNGNSQFLGYKALTLVSRDAGAVFNLYFLLTFPLSAMLFMAAARRLGLSYLASACGGVLFALLPYHFWRGEAHVQLASYYTLPLLLPPLATLMSGDSLMWGSEARTEVPDGGGPPLSPELPSRSIRVPRELAWTAVAVLAVGASAGYYVLIAVFFVVLAGLVGAARTRKWQPAVGGIVLSAALAASLALNMAPSIAYRAANGPNTVGVGARFMHENEEYPLKLIQMVLPVWGHRLPPLARLRERYRLNFPLVNENEASALGGLVGSSFIALLALSLFGRPRILDRLGRQSAGLLQGLATLSLGGVLLGIMGGVGSFVALLVTTQLRGYNRVSIFIAMFAIVALGLVGDALVARRRERGRYVASVVAVLLVVAVGLWDMTSTHYRFDGPEKAREWKAEGAFMDTLQSRLPAGAAVFQLPYLWFPEGEPAGQVRAYDQLTPYVHTHGLRWSFGAVHGRGTDPWYRRTAAAGPSRMIDEVRAKGFAAILIDRRGYEDRATELESGLRPTCGPPALESPDGRWVLFEIPPDA